MIGHQIRNHAPFPSPLVGEVGRGGFETVYCWCSPYPYPLPTRGRGSASFLTHTLITVSQQWVEVA